MENIFGLIVMTLAEHLVLPLFVREGEDQKDAINAMPGCYRMSIDHIVTTCKKAYDLGG